MTLTCMTCLRRTIFRSNRIETGVRDQKSNKDHKQIKIRDQQIKVRIKTKTKECGKCPTQEAHFPKGQRLFAARRVLTLLPQNFARNQQPCRCLPCLQMLLRGESSHFYADFLLGLLRGASSAFCSGSCVECPPLFARALAWSVLRFLLGLLRGASSAFCLGSCVEHPPLFARALAWSVLRFLLGLLRGASSAFCSDSCVERPPLFAWALARSVLRFFCS